ncbi:Leucine-rich repeat transmembrane protein kinase 1 [Musa troglodytarum]|uniref:Leucine-rich repeat transmembrane protein kinase 1 n=1 Tax=Musa troglodytarum TaxID=320322 RepID=A0A9E7JWY7_9LILI|nr:Leucine-rich repeat transmembrane protein kinase 1 [Musa troglodytarum]
MLELLTGRKPFDSSKPRIEQSLVRWAAAQLHDIDALERMVKCSLNLFWSSFRLAALLQTSASLSFHFMKSPVVEDLWSCEICPEFVSEPEFWPPMSEVVQSLVRCVQRTSINKRLGGDLSTSWRSDDSDYGYY